MSHAIIHPMCIPIILLLSAGRLACAFTSAPTENPHLRTSSGRLPCPLLVALLPTSMRQYAPRGA